MAVGTNLLRFTGHPTYAGAYSVANLENGWCAWNSGNGTFERTDGGIKYTASGSSNGFVVPLCYAGILKGGSEEVITISFKYRGTFTGAFPLYLINASGGNVTKTTTSKLVSSTSEWAEFSDTLYFPSVGNKTSVGILVPYTSTSGKWFEVKDESLKLELGSEATEWTPSPYDTGVTGMVKGIGETTITDETDIDSLVTWYRLSESDTSTIRTNYKTALDAITSSSTTPSGWSTNEPAFQEGSTNYLHTVIQTRWKDGTCTWGDVQLSSSYEASKQAYNRALAAQGAIDSLEIGGRNLVIDSTTFRVGTVQANTLVQTVEDGMYKMVVSAGNTANWNASWWPAKDAAWSNVENNLAEGDSFVISFLMRAVGSTKKPTVYIKPYMGYYEMSGDLSENWSTIYYAGTWIDTGAISPHLGWSGVSTASTYYIKAVKVEKGNKPTDWTPAPEDTDSAISTAKTEAISTATSNATSAANSYTDTVASEISSRGEQLITNGSGTLGNNTNFSAWTYDPSVAMNGSAGSFTFGKEKAYRTPKTDEFFPVSATEQYLLSYDVRAETTDSELPILYSYVNMYDIDKNEIIYGNVHYPDGTMTTLAQELKAGDTTVYLTDVSSSWVYASNQCGLSFWNYTNSKGYTYPVGTYTRNYYSNLYSSQSAINTTNNTITLNSAWTGPTYAAGTAVSMSQAGATYTYVAAGGIRVTSEVMHRTGTIGPGFMPTNTAEYVPYKFREGTAYAKIGFLWNYQAKSNAQIWLANLSFRIYTATHSEVAEALADGVEYIVGTQTASTNAWTGVTKDAALYDGKAISYKLPYAGGSSAATLNLTLSGGATTGAKAIKMAYNTSNNTANLNDITTHWPAGSIIPMVYDGSRWIVSNYNTNVNTFDRRQHNNSITAVTAVTKEHLIAGTVDGYKQLAASLAFDLSYPILYASAAITAAETSAVTYEAMPSVKFTTTGAIQSAGANKMLYLKGSVSGNTFTIAASNWLTTVVPSTEDGYVYIPLGVMVSSTNGYFSSSKDLYAFLDGEFRQVTPTEIVATHKVYYRTDTELATDQAMQAIKPSSWVSDSAGIVYNQWTPALPPVAAYASSGTDDGYVKYPYVYTCEQRKRLDGTVESTAVVEHQADLVVDGDAIIDGTISANKLVARSITAEYIDSTNLQVSSANITDTLTVDQIDTSGITLTKTQIESLDDDLAALSSDIDSQASALTDSVGVINQAIETTNESLSSLTQTVTNVSSELDGRIRAITDGVDVKADHISLFTQTTVGNETQRMEARLTSDKLAFMQDNVEVAYIGDESMYITNAIVQDTLTLGDFAFVPLASGGLALKWDPSDTCINLLRGTGSIEASDCYLSRSTVSDGIITLTPTTSSAYAKLKVDYLGYSDYANKTLTFSFDARISDAETTYTTEKILGYIGANASTRLNYNFSTSYDRYTSETITALTSGWKRFAITKTIPDDFTSGTTDALVSSSYVTVQFGVSGSCKPVDVRNVMLEVGSTAHPWRPNPND